MSRTPFTYCPYCATPLETRILDRHERPVCPACGYIYFSDPKVAVIALVQQDGRVLLVRRAVNPAKGLWALPGGYMDAGELPEAALRREVQEEVGLAVTVDHLLAIYPMINGSGPSQGIVLAYRAAPLDGQTHLTPQDDVSEAGWFAPDELPAGLAFDSTKTQLAAWRAAMI
jgi:ADP-ribose pyrophosphatase YjhB (NUDIX family)